MSCPSRAPVIASSPSSSASATFPPRLSFDMWTEVHRQPSTRKATTSLVTTAHPPLLQTAQKRNLTVHLRHASQMIAVELALDRQC